MLVDREDVTDSEKNRKQVAIFVIRNFVSLFFMNFSRFFGIKMNVLLFRFIFNAEYNAVNQILLDPPISSDLSTLDAISTTCFYGA